MRSKQIGKKVSEKLFTETFTKKAPGNKRETRVLKPPGNKREKPGHL